MATTYRYRAVDGAGHAHSGSLEADGQDVVVERIRRMGFVPVSVEARARSLLNVEIELGGLRGARVVDLAVFTRQLATMVGSGLPLLRCLAALAGQTGNKSLTEALGAVRMDVETGDSLSAALALHPRWFDTYFVSMVRAGEAAGSLDTVLAELAVTLEQSTAMRRKIRAAMAYPMVILAFTLIVLTGMLVFLVPQFKDIYADLQGRLPIPTRILLAASGALVNGFVFVAVGGVAAFVGLRTWKRSPSGGRRWDGWKLRAPVFGPLASKAAQGRMTRTLGALLSSGVPVLEALDITVGTVDNVAVADAVAEVREAVRSGQPMAAPLGAHPLFDPMLVHMVSVGEETGELSSLLVRTADFYQAEVEAAVDKFASLIEPLLLVVMGVTVGAMVIALYLPMFKVIELVQ